MRGVRWIRRFGTLRAVLEDLRILSPFGQYNDRKRRIHASSPPGVKVKVPKVRLHSSTITAFKDDANVFHRCLIPAQTEFHKSLAFNLPRLRRIDRVKREKLYGTELADVDMSDSDEDEYQYRTTRSKRRKVED